MTILGITYLSHDASATLIVDGQVVAMAEQERFSRHKHDHAFPREAIEFVLAEAGLTAADIDVLSVPYAFFNGIGRRLWYGVRNFRKCPSFLLRNVGYEVLTHGSFEDRIRSEFQHSGLALTEACRVVNYEHHLCHAASTYLASPYERSVIISWDGRGEWPCILYAVAEGDHIEVLGRCYFPDSIGQVYQAVTQYLGFSDVGDEYKVMGLAPYGTPRFVDVFRKVFRVQGWKVSVNREYLNYHIYNRHMTDRFSMKLSDELGPARVPGAPITQHYMDVAASIQACVNEVGVKVARALKGYFPDIDNLCLTGGVAQNIVMNQHIAEGGGFKNVFVAPASYDGGLSQGAALLAAHAEGEMTERFVMTHGAWGSQFSTESIEAELNAYNLPFYRPNNLIATTANMIADGQVVGWFHGRAEFGPRALGQRSILADPRRAEMKDIVNRKIKFREEFRPFAPSILAERFDDYFEGAPASPYMTFAARVREERRADLPAVTHVDGTARPQAVTRTSNPRYHALLRAVEARTGVPVVLNTSFNVKGEPIVNSPADAVKCFFSTGLDFLVLEDLVVYKADDRARVAAYDHVPGAADAPSVSSTLSRDRAPLEAPRPLGVQA